MRDMMLDLETLSSSPRAAIVQIGACMFDRETGEIGDRFKVVTAPDLDKYDVSYDTLHWWFGQSVEAQDAIMPRETLVTIPLNAALEDFLRHFVLHQDTATLCVWATPTTFDNVILENALRTEGFIVPWRHYNARDCRTLFELAGIEKEDRVKPELAHDALSDAIAQAKTVAKAIQRLK